MANKVSKSSKKEAPQQLRAVIYARYSSHNQREESIEGQLRECHDFAKRNDILVVGEYIDRALTGKTDDRADFQRMIRDSDRHFFTLVITYKIDRFARNRYDSARYKFKLKKNGVKVVYAKETIPDGPEGILLESMLEGYAEYYSENLAQNIKRGLTENAMECRTNGNKTFGYKTGKDQRFEIDPEQAPIVRRIFELYDAGITMANITNDLNEKGVKTSRGNPFNKNSLDRILRNEKYIGVYEYMDIRVEDGIPPIVERELFDSVQRKLNRNKRAPAHRWDVADYLLTTKLFCGHCGQPMTGRAGTGKSGKKYNYYSCVTRTRKKGCNKEPAPKDWIEDLVISETIKLILRDDIIEEIADGVMAFQEREKDRTIVNSLMAKLKEVEKGIKNMLAAIEAGIITSSTKTRLLELENEKADLEYGITQENIQQPVIERDQVIFWLERFRKGDIEDQKYRKDLIDIFVNAIYLYDDNRLVIIYNYSGENNTITLDMVDEEVSKMEESGGSPLDSSAPPTARVRFLGTMRKLYLKISPFAYVQTLPNAKF